MKRPECSIEAATKGVEMGTTLRKLMEVCNNRTVFLLNGGEDNDR